MCENILFAVTGSCFASIKGVLHGYHRKTIKGEIYPGIVACSGGVIEGLVYKDLTETEWNRLDLFEGDQYRREIVSVKFEKGSREPAETYLLKSEFADRLSSQDWDFEEFLKFNKKIFEANYSGFEILQQSKV